MQLIDPTKERLPGSSFTPSTYEQDLAAGATTELEIQGKDANEFGVTAILPFATAPDDVVVTEVSMNKGRDPWWSRPGMSVRALYRYFEDYRLDAPAIIKEKRTLTFTFENRGSSAVDIGIQVTGLTSEQLAVREKHLRRRLGTVPRPMWVWARSEVNAGAKNQSLDLNFSSEAQVFDRLALAAEANEAAVRAKLRADFTDVIPESYVSQINRRFDGHGARPPYEVGPSANFAIDATNTAVSAQDVSAVAVSYRKRDVEALL